MQSTSTSQQPNGAGTKSRQRAEVSTNFANRASSAPPDTRPQSFLSLKHVIARCSLSRSTIYAYMKRGHFPKPYLVGTRAVRFLETEIDGWIEQHVRR